MRNDKGLLLKLRIGGMLGAFVALLLAQASRAADLNVALIGTLTGPAAGRAVDQEAGLHLGLKDSGGHFGGVEFSLVRYDGYDDHRNPDEAKRIFQTLTQGSRLNVLFLSSADARTAETLAPLAEASGTLILNLGDALPELAGRACSANFFSVVGLAETMHAMDGQYLQGLGVHTLVAAGSDDAATRQALAAFQHTYHGKVIEAFSPPGRMSFSAELAQIQGMHPDAIYLLHTGGMAVEFLAQFAASDLKTQVPIVAPFATFDQTLLAASAPSALDATSVGPWSDDLENPANHRLATEFELEFGRPPSAEVALGYDAALLLDAAVRSLNKKPADTDQLRVALRRVEFASTRGVVKFDTNHFPIQTYIIRQVVADNRQRLVNSQKGILVHDVRDGHAADCPMRWVAEPAEAAKKK